MTSPLVAPATPARTTQQRMEALEAANEIRTARAQLKKQVKAGEVRAVEVVADPPAAALTMRVRALLIQSRGLGDVKVDQILSRCRISPAKTLGGLSSRQRTELVTELAAREQSR